MNRKHRRGIARLQRRAICEPVPKHSHKLIPQTCALWVPAASGYVTHFSPQGFGVIEHADLARHYDEDEAASAAVAFYEVTGLRVAVRPVYLQHVSP